MLNELRHAMRMYADATNVEFQGDDPEYNRRAIGAATEEVVRVVRELLEEPTNVQALALARLMRSRRRGTATLGLSLAHHSPDAFVLANYWTAVFADDGFECGIAPDGSVSS